MPAPLEEKLALSPFITNVMLYGDNQPYNVALIIPDMEALRKWAGEHGVDTSDPATLARDAKVRRLFEEQLAQYSADFKQFEKVRKFVLGLEDFSTDNEMLTPSLKVKRRNVMKHYGQDLDHLFAA